MRQVWNVIKLMMFGAVTVMALAACGGGEGGETSITGATLKSILVTPANPSIAMGLTMQFTATGTYSDGTSHLITSSVTWTSGTTSVATVDVSGLATGIGAGSSVITAALGSVSGNTTLTVTGLTPSFSSAGTWTGANGNGDSIKVVNEFVTYIYSAAWELTFTFYSGAGSPCGGRVFTSEFVNYPWTNNGREFAASVGISGGGTINMTFRGTSPNSAVVTWQASAQLCGKPVDNTWTVTKQ